MAIIHCRPRDPFEDHDHALTTRCETNQTHERLSHGNESLILAGVIKGIEAVSRELAKNFPPDARGHNELPDKPVVI